MQGDLQNNIYKQTFSSQGRLRNITRNTRTPEDFLLVLLEEESGSMDIDFLSKGTLFARGGKGDFRDSFSDAMIV